MTAHDLYTVLIIAWIGTCTTCNAYNGTYDIQCSIVTCAGQARCQYASHPDNNAPSQRQLRLQCYLERRAAIRAAGKLLHTVHGLASASTVQQLPSLLTSHAGRTV